MDAQERNGPDSDVWNPRPLKQSWYPEESEGHQEQW